jgi:hypothetical protein
MCVCVVVFCFVGNNHYVIESGLHYSLTTLTPDVVERNSETRYFSGFR